MESNTSSDDEYEYDDYENIFVNRETIVNNTYVHELFKHLHTDEEPIFNNNITLILFNIMDLSKKNKFIQFMLEKKNEVLAFPSIKISQNIKAEIAQLLNVNVSILKYKGYITFQNSIYLFIQIDKIFTPLFMQCDQQYWFCILDEIVNYKKVCNFRIDNSCCNFLLSNPDFYILKNPDTCRRYEIPIIAYSGNIFNQVELDGNFGISKKNEYSLFGPHYYFTTYEKAVEMGGWSLKKEKYTEGGINRYAVFCGNQEIIYKPQLNYNIPDDSDSIYVGEMQLNSKHYNDSPMWIVKSSENFKSLTYHLLDKATLGEIWNRDYTQYFIS